jgi:hypothetical protein
MLDLNDLLIRIAAFITRSTVERRRCDAQEQGEMTAGPSLTFI